ncbi:MAG: 1-acyl-sn-glycerol-3-phosphate acyltransferase [Myxococcales bacterium]|nr:1-acyl-sn-glycerol-3-phosphate acyltransferase [Polyangiaceae bacterium]MDW8251173.1 1-acyl-sn-glycerol-3-phosphate acyltransferase [Myxococcales bacterium]
MVRPWADHYFRASVSGLKRIPQARPALLAMNHSGMGWPWDAIVLMHLMARHHDYQRSWVLRGFALPFFFELPGLGPLILRVGLYPASFRHLERLASEGELVLYFPEGVAGIGKGWRRRYQLQNFHTSFVKVAVRHRAPVLPCVCIGAEELNPLAENLPRLARLTRLPIFPLSPLQLVFFPTWLTSAFFALPSRLRYEIGDSVRFALDPATATEADYQAAAAELRQEMQRMLDRARRNPAYPDPPAPPRPSPFVYEYRLEDRALAMLPFGWPLLYLRFWNAYQATCGVPPAPGRPAWAPHKLDGLDELFHLAPWGWLLSLFRHRKAMLSRSDLPIEALMAG